jgi:hypothetical protein
MNVVHASSPGRSPGYQPLTQHGGSVRGAVRDMAVRGPLVLSQAEMSARREERQGIRRCERILRCSALDMSHARLEPTTGRHAGELRCGCLGSEGDFSQ